MTCTERRELPLQNLSVYGSDQHGHVRLGVRRVSPIIAIPHGHHHPNQIHSHLLQLRIAQSWQQARCEVPPIDAGVVTQPDMAWVAADGRVVPMVVETIIKPEEIHKPEEYDPSSIKGGHTFEPGRGRL